MIDEDVRALWEPWMMQADRLLDDEELIDRVFEAQGVRHEHSAARGRSQTPAEMVLRLLLLKHERNWSFDVLEREVRMNLCHRDFARIGMSKAPDAKTLARIAQALGGEGIAELHRRLVEIAQGLSRVRPDVTVAEVRFEAVRQCILKGKARGRELAFLGAVMKRAGLVSTEEFRRSDVDVSHGNLHRVWKRPS